MLQDFRAGIGKHGKWLVVLIAIPFAFFGVETLFFSGASVEEVARVDGERISRLELEQAVQRQRSFLLQRFGDIDPAVIDEEMLRGPALESLVTTRALANRARAEDMGVAPELIARVLKDAQLFWIDGKFSQDSYLVYLRQMGYTPQTHNRFLAREILVSQLARGLTQTAFVTPPELSRAVAILEETRDFSYLSLPLGELREEVEITDAQVEQYYRDNAEQFTIPERVVLNYVELSEQAMATEVVVDDEAVRARYEDRVKAAEAASQSIVAQIFVRPQEDGSHTEKLERISRALAEGEAFSVLAATESEDPLSAENGGEIGPYVPEDFPPRLREVIEGLEIGAVSTPVETDQGWHILSLVREDRPEVAPFEEVRDELRAEIAAEKAREQFGEQLAQLEELAYTSADLSSVAEQLALPLQVSEPLTRSGGEGLGADPKVLSAAFSEPVLDEGYASPVLELATGRAVVVELKERHPPTVQPLEVVRAEIVEQMAAERATALAGERAAELRKRLDAGEPIAEVAADADLEWHAHLDVGRYDQQFDRALLESVFSAAARGSLPISGVVARAEAVDVFQVKAIHPGQLEALPEARQRELQQALSGARASREFNAYEELVVAAADVEVREMSDQSR